MSEHKLLLLDVDGTTTESNGDALPSERVIHAVTKAREAGVHVALATGRAHSLSLPVIDALELSGPSVFSGGAEIVDVSTDKILHRQLLEVKTLQQLAQLALPFGYGVRQDVFPIKKVEQIEYPAARFLIRAVDPKHVEEVLEEVSCVKGVVAHDATSWTKGARDVHVTHEYATKRHGAERLMGMLGVSRETSIAVGDSDNDGPLFEAVGERVAMGNAIEELKRRADWIVPSLAEDGVAVAIEELILQE